MAEQDWVKLNARVDLLETLLARVANSQLLTETLSELEKGFRETLSSDQIDRADRAKSESALQSVEQIQRLVVYYGPEDG